MCVYMYLDMSYALSYLSLWPYLSRFLELHCIMYKNPVIMILFSTSFTETGESVTQLTTQTHQGMFLISQLMKATVNTPTPVIII